MSRIWLLPAAMVVLAGAAPAADGASDTTAAVMSECSAPDIPAAAVDSCLERVRILEETDTSPGLASLEARLEVRVSSDHEPVGPIPSTNRSVEVRPYSAGPGGGSDAGPANETDAAEAATGAPRSLESEGTAAAPAENAEAGGEEGGNAAPDAGVSAAANTASANPPPDVSPDDEPPIADPPDTEAPQSGTGEEGLPPGEGGQGG